MKSDCCENGVDIFLIPADSPGTVDGSRRDLPLPHSSDALGPSSFLLADTIDAEGKDLKRRSSDADEDTEEVQFQEEEDLSPAMKHILGDTDEDHLGDDARAAQHAQMAKKMETRESVEHERSLGHGQGGVSDAGGRLLHRFNVGCRPSLIPATKTSCSTCRDTRLEVTTHQTGERSTGSSHRVVWKEGKAANQVCMS